MYKYCGVDLMQDLNCSVRKNESIHLDYGFDVQMIRKINIAAKDNLWERGTPARECRRSIHLWH
jgi:hypothetical protein